MTSCLFTFVREGTMYVEFNSVTLFAVLYTRFLNCAKDISTVTAQPTILEYSISHTDLSNYVLNCLDVAKIHELYIPVQFLLYHNAHFHVSFAELRWVIHVSIIAIVTTLATV